MSRNIDALVAEKVMGGFGMTPFRCPKCGGRKWGSSKLPGEEFVAHCHSDYCRWSGPRDGTTVPLYSTDPVAAMQVKDRLLAIDFGKYGGATSLSSQWNPYEQRWEVAIDWSDSTKFTAQHESEPMAWCLLALSALGVETKGEEHAR